MQLRGDTKAAYGRDFGSLLPKLQPGRRAGWRNGGRIDVWHIADCIMAKYVGRQRGLTYRFVHAIFNDCCGFSSVVLSFANRFSPLTVEESVLILIRHG